MMTLDGLRLMVGKEQRKLPDGTNLRLLTAMEVLEARREAMDMCGETGAEQALCSNACLLARAWVKGKRSVYETGEEVLRHLSVSQIQALARQWAEFDRAENPGIGEEEGRIDALKKA